MLQADSSPSTSSAACVSNNADVEFGDASDNLPVPEISAPADLDQAQVHPQRVLPKLLQVPLILPVPRMPMDNCAKLPPEAPEVLDQADDYHKNVILATVERSSSSKVSTFSTSECLLDNLYLFVYYANGFPIFTPLPLPIPAPPKDFGSHEQVLTHTGDHPRPTDDLTNIHHALSNNLASVLSNNMVEPFAISVLMSCRKALNYGEADYQYKQHTTYSAHASSGSTTQPMVDCRALSGIKLFEGSSTCEVYKTHCIIGVQDINIV